ncbi:MAG: hypothetical protein Q8Q41_01590, partial [bacterium]|nr:hypothetical protein [bacterium]
MTPSLFSGRRATTSPVGSMTAEIPVLAARRIHCRLSTARSRVVPIAYDEFAPMQGAPVTAGEKQIGV